MANLNLILTPFITGCFGMASGIFFLLYCLEKPIYSPVLNNTDRASSEAQMRRTLLVLQQLLSFQVPTVMVTLITCGILGSVFRVVVYGYAFLPVLVVLSSVLVFIISGASVPSAIEIFKSTSPEASSDKIQAALAPIISLHRNIGIFVAVILVVQLVSTAF